MKRGPYRRGHRFKRWKVGDQVVYAAYGWFPPERGTVTHVKSTRQGPEYRVKFADGSWDWFGPTDLMAPTPFVDGDIVEVEGEYWLMRVEDAGLGNGRKHFRSEQVTPPRYANPR